MQTQAIISSLRRAFIALAVALLALTVIAPLEAQQTVIDGRLLPLRVDTFIVSYSGTVIGKGIMARSRTAQGQLLQVYEWRGAGGDVIVDTLVSELPSLRTVRETRVLGDTTIAAAYQGDSVRIAVAVKGRTLARNTLAPQASFSSAAIETLAAAAPLAEGYRLDQRVYYLPPAPHGAQEIGVRVTGSARVGDRDAWVVAATTPGGGTTYWIDKATRAVLKYDTREGPAVIEFRR